MANGNDCLNIGIDLKQWKSMTDEERIEQTFYCLRFLTKEAQKNRVTERCLTLIGTITANLVVLVPVIWWVVSHVK